MFPENLRFKKDIHYVYGAAHQNICR